MGEPERRNYRGDLPQTNERGRTRHQTESVANRTTHGGEPSRVETATTHKSRPNTRGVYPRASTRNTQGSNTNKCNRRGF